MKIYKEVSHCAPAVMMFLNLWFERMGLNFTAWCNANQPWNNTPPLLHSPALSLYFFQWTAGGDTIGWINKFDCVFWENKGPLSDLISRLSSQSLISSLLQNNRMFILQIMIQFRLKKKDDKTGCVLDYLDYLRIDWTDPIRIEMIDWKSFVAPPSCPNMVVSGPNKKMMLTTIKPNLRL